MNFPIKIGLVFILLLSCWCFFRWQPERQVRLHQRYLLEAAQKRDWAKLSALLDDSFRTPGGLNKTVTLQDTAEVLQPFFTLQINGTETSLSVKNGTGIARLLLRVEGRGGPVAEMVKSAVNDSNEPFEFTWKRASWKPWDWRLVKAAHPLITLAETQSPPI